MTITIALDSVTPQDMTATAWAKGYAAYLASELTDSAGEDVEVRLGDRTYIPSDLRDAASDAWHTWCGMSDAEQSEWID